MSAARYVANRAGVAALLHDGALVGYLHRLAGQAAGAARASAPRETGRYAASITVREVTTDRPVVRVYADVPYAAGVEFGGSGRTGRRVLGNALESL